ncbi:MAG: sulfatase-like hydrolase/transferase, partial [Opitutae bacterium]|nr:sulfatase-like hydrolase/transferase [Opitutae bacterium]
MTKPYLSFLVLILSFTVLAEAKSPNVVFVLFDDIGYGQPPSYRKGSPFKTPNIDRLAEQGMRFTD